MAHAHGQCSAQPSSRRTSLTSYGACPLSDLLAEIDAYYRFYPVDGIFLDEMANDPNGLTAQSGLAAAAYYKHIHDHVKAGRSTHNIVIGNPGSAATTAWQLDAPVADNLVVFEGPMASYLNWSSPSWARNRPANKFSNLVYSTTSAQGGQACNLSRSRNAGLIDVTDDGPPNPWDTLPSYWPLVAPACL